MFDRLLDNVQQDPLDIEIVAEKISGNIKPFSKDGWRSCSFWNIFQLLSVWDEKINVFYFNFGCHEWYLIKNMVESSLLSKDEPLTLNIDKVVGV